MDKNHDCLDLYVTYIFNNFFIVKNKNQEIVVWGHGKEMVFCCIKFYFFRSSITLLI